MTPVDDHARAFLGQAIRNPSILADYHATLSWFPNLDDARFYRGILACIAMGINPDIIALADQFRAQGMDDKEAACLAASIDPCSSANAGYYAGKLSAAARARELKMGFGVISEMLDSGADSHDVEAKVSRLVEESSKAEGIARFKPVSIESERIADIPSRQWAIDGIIPCGELTIIGARKGMGKTWLALQAGAAIVSGTPFLGLQTFKGRVLYWPSELDRIGIHERAQRLGQLHPDFDVMYEPLPRGRDFIKVLPAIIREYGYKAVIVDMMQAILPDGTDANDYGIGTYLLEIRRIAMDTGAAIVGTWHNGKAERDDPVLSLIGSTGIGAQCGSIITLDRKRGEPGVKLYVSGNHTRERTVRARFVDGLFEECEAGEEEGPRVSAADKLVLDVVQAHPDGIAVTTLSGTISKEANSIRAALSRLGGRGLVDKRVDNRWYPTIVREPTLIGVQSAQAIAHKAHESAQSAPCAPLPEGLEAHRTAPAPIGAVRSCATLKPVRHNDGIDNLEYTIIEANANVLTAAHRHEPSSLDYGYDDAPSGAYGENPEYCEVSENDIF